MHMVGNRSDTLQQVMVTNVDTYGACNVDMLIVVTEVSSIGCDNGEREGENLERRF